MRRVQAGVTESWELPTCRRTLLLVALVSTLYAELGSAQAATTFTRPAICETVCAADDAATSVR